MKSLSIRLDVPALQSDFESNESMEVRHLATREFTRDYSTTTLPPSPGIRILLPVRGLLVCRIARKTIRVPQGVAFVCSGNSRIDLTFDRIAEYDQEAENRFRMLEINAILNRTIRIEERLQIPALADYTQSAQIAGLFDQLNHAAKSTILTSGSPDILPNIVALMLISLIIEIAGIPIQSLPEPPKSDRLSILRTYMTENMDNRSMTTAAMAAHLSMSRATFCEWAKANLGQSPKYYLKQMRLERSQELLAQGRDSIETISEKTGFANRFHFDKEFKEHFKITPAAYRRQVAMPLETDYLRPALEFFRKAHFAEAMQACEQGLASSHADAVQDQLRFLKGCCLEATGFPRAALDIWQSLLNGHYAYQAGMNSSRLLFTSGRYDHAARYLRACYQKADNHQQAAVVSLWMEQVQDLYENRKPQPLRAYLDIRKKNFVHDDASMNLTARVLLAMGQYEEVLKQCATMPKRCFQALERMGKLDEAIRRYGKHVNTSLHKAIFCQCGQWERVLAMPPENADMDTRALIGLGRYEEAMRRGPMHASEAYLALGRYRELIEAFPETDIHYLFALHALGQIDDMKRLAEKYPQLAEEAQMYLDPSAILSTPSREAEIYRPLATMLLTLNALNAGDTKRAVDLLETCEGVDSPDLWATYSSTVVLLLTTVLRGFLIGPQRMQDDLDLILSRFRYFRRQSLWYDAAYLTRRITRARFMQQPFQLDIQNHFLLIDAIAHDFGNRPSKAHASYEAFLQNTRPYPSSNLMLHRFVQWRQKILV